MHEPCCLTIGNVQIQKGRRSGYSTVRAIYSFHHFQERTECTLGEGFSCNVGVLLKKIVHSVQIHVGKFIKNGELFVANSDGQLTLKVIQSLA